MNSARVISSCKLRTFQPPEFTIINVALIAFMPNEHMGAININDINYASASYCCSNPTERTIQEAEKQLGSTTKVLCLVSIGSGKGPIADLALIDKAGRNNEALEKVEEARLSSYCEQVHNNIQHRIAKLRLYFRFNVEHGLASMNHLNAGIVETHTSTYLQTSDIRQLMGSAVGRVVSEDKGKPLSMISKIKICSITMF